MKVDIKLIKDEPLEKEFEIIISKDYLQKALMDNLEKKAVKTKISGFRPGKIPFSILFQQEGQEATEKVVRETVIKHSNTFKEGLKLAAPITYRIQSSIDGMTWDHLNDVRVGVFCSLMPECPNIDWKSIILPSYDVQPTDEEVHEASTEQVAKYTTSLPLAEKRPAQIGDTILYQMHYEDMAGKTKDVEGAFLLGSGMLPKEFEDALVGVSEGHVFNERIRVPKDFQEKSLAGKKIAFTIKFIEIRQTVPHQLDDAFAQSQGAKNLAEYSKKIKDQLIQKAKSMVQILQGNYLITSVKPLLQFDVPSMLLDQEYDLLLSNSPFAKLASEAEKTTFLTEMHQSEEEYKDTLKVQAKDRVRLSLLLKEIITDQNFSVDAKELENYAQAIAWKTQTPIAEVIEFLRRNPQKTEPIIDDILEGKAIEWAYQQCQHTPRVISLADLYKEIEKKTGSKEELTK